MKKRRISFLLALMLICKLLATAVPFEVHAASQSNYPPYASIEYGYSTSVTCGTIRYIRQSVDKTYFYWDYWPGSAFGNYKGPGNECGTACISMALSYIGINKTPNDILKKYNGSTVFDGGWGATYMTTSIAAGMNNYLNGNGKYSPVIIHLNYGQSISANDPGHFVLIVGKVSDNVWQILDPATESLQNYTINGSSISYMGVNNTIDSVRQYYNPNAAIVKDYAKEKCTPYPCAVKIKVTEDCCPYTQPCNPTTASELGYVSEKLTNKPISKNEVLTADALYENTEGNYWYHVTLSDGTKAYLYSTHTTRSSIMYPWVDGGSFPSTITGTTNLQGTVTTGGSRLDTVQALVCRQGTTSPVLRSDLVTVNATTYPLKSSTVDKTTVFGNLSNYGSGYYTLMIDTAFTTYYADNNQLKSAALCDYAATYDFYYGQPTVPNVTITFNANGGSCSTSTKVIASGSAIGTLPTATRSGYTFDGWYTSASGGNKISTSTTFSSNTTVYAHWSASTYTVSYNANGGSGAPSSQTATVGNYIDLSWEIPTRFGYSFQGWATDSSASSVVYWPGDVYTDDTSITLYAVWREAEVLSGDTVGQFGEIAYINCPDAGVYYAFIPNTSTEYRIMSESDEDVCVDLFDANGNLIASDDDSGDGTNFLLTFNFTANETYYIYVRYYSSSLVGTIDFKVSKRYSITYDANGGTGAPETQYHFYDEAVTLSNEEPTRSGYLFVGWSTSNTAVDPDYLPGDIYSGSANLALYAVWQADSSIIASGACGNDATWTLYSNGLLELCGGDIDSYSDTEPAPWYDYRDIITDATLEDGIRVIDNYLFYNCTNLRSVDIPDSVTWIGYSAFANCEKLNDIQLPPNLNWIYDGAFRGCKSLEYIEIPGGIAYIRPHVFSGCSSLKSITIPSNVISIDGGAFASCSSMTEIIVAEGNTAYTTLDGVLFTADMTELVQYPAGKNNTIYDIPEGVTTVISSAFSGASNLVEVNFPDGFETFEEYAFRNCTGLTAIVIPSSVESIDVLAFGDCSNLVSVEIMEGVKIIRDFAFQSCSKLTSIVIPESITTIRDYIFNACRSFSEITFMGDAPAFGANAFYGNTVTAYYPADNETWTEDVLQQYGGTVTWIPIGDKLELLASGICGPNLVWNLTFDGCLTISGTGEMYDFGSFDSPWFDYNNQILSVVIENGVTSIGNYAFNYCSYVLSVQIPNSVTVIGSSAFDDCRNLAELNLPSNLVSIGSHAFYDCSSLSSIVIPASVTTIGNYAFWDCTSLEEVVVESANQEYSSCDGVLYNKQQTTLITYPAGKAGSFAIPDSVNTIGDYAFYNAEKMVAVIIPDHVVSIGDSAFRGCTSIQTLEIPGSVSTIPGYMCCFCESLLNITIPSNITLIERYAFANCDALAQITFEGNAPTFDEDVFLNVTAEARYPANNSTWTADVMQDYSGTITWISYKLEKLPFTDVPEGSFFYDPVEWAVENGITNGTSATTFGPNDQCMRAHVVTFLWRAMGSPEPKLMVNPFVDVKPTDFYYKPVLWALENGITSGMDATHFGPTAYCNRAQVVTFLYRTMGSPAVDASKNPFTDVAAGSFYEKPVLWAVENGITNGLSAASFGPNSICNRAQIVTFLYRAYN